MALRSLFPPRHVAGRWVPIGLWALFAALVLAGGMLVLRACGTWPVLGFVRNYCPAPPDGAFAREVATGERLRRQVHAAEMTLVEAPPCAPPAQPIAQPPSPPPLLPPAKPVSPPRSAESKEIDKRVERDRGGTGRLQITLAWNTLDDLDLNITCPGGRITSANGKRGPGICGDGVKDIDANRNLVENVSLTPVENVVWTDEVPEGEYRIEVIEFRAKNDGNSVPYTLRIRLGDEERECHGAVTVLARRSRFERNGEVQSGTAQLIIWHSGQPLPDCNLIDIPTVLTGTGK